MTNESIVLFIEREREKRVWNVLSYKTRLSNLAITINARKSPPNSRSPCDRSNGRTKQMNTFTKLVCLRCEKFLGSRISSNSLNLVINLFEAEFLFSPHRSRRRYMFVFVLLVYEDINHDLIYATVFFVSLSLSPLICRIVFDGSGNKINKWRQRRRTHFPRCSGISNVFFFFGFIFFLSLKFETSLWLTMSKCIMPAGTICKNVRKMAENMYKNR